MEEQNDSNRTYMGQGNLYVSGQSGEANKLEQEDRVIWEPL